MADISPDSERQIGAYLDSILRPDVISNDHRLSYLAVRHGGQMVLLAGTLRSNLGSRRRRIETISSPTVMSREVELADCAASRGDLVEQLIEGELEVGGQTLIFPQEANSSLTVFHRPNIHFGSGNGRVENALQLSGVQRDRILDYTAVSMALKAVPLYHGSLEHLVSQHSMVANFGAVGFWLVSSPVIEIEGISRRATNGRRLIQLSLRPGFDPDLVLLGINPVDMHSKNAMTLDRDQISWKRRDDRFIGIAPCHLAPKHRLECVAIYDHVAQHVQQFSG